DDRRFGACRLRSAPGRRLAARGACQARPVRRRARPLLAARRAAAAAVRAGGRWTAGRTGDGRGIAVARFGARRRRRAADPDRTGGPGGPRRRGVARPAVRLRALPLARRARRIRWTGRRPGVKTEVAW